MDAVVMPIILLVVIAIFTVVFIAITNKQKKNVNNKSGKSGKSESNASSTTSTKTTDDIKREDVFKFMEFDKIIDNMIVQKNETRYTMAIKCKGINYDLMSEVEQMAVEEGFITFLNTLKFPIQLYVQAQNIDLKGAIAKYRENVSEIKDEFESIDDEYTKMLERFDTSEEEINDLEKERNKVLNVYEYATDIINYVERMSLNKNLLQRSFYILVSYNKSDIAAADTFSKNELESICYTELATRCQGVINALTASSVEGKILDSNELADLLYTAYNRDDKGIMNIREAVESGFYRLYSTSEDAFYRKTQVLNEQIENEARIRAIEALKDSINNGTYASPTTEQLEVEEKISKIAVEMIKNENIPEEMKNNAKKTVIEEYKNAKKQLLEQLEDEQQTILEVDSQKLAKKMGEAAAENNVPKGNDGIMRSNEMDRAINTVEVKKENIENKSIEQASNENVDNSKNVNQTPSSDGDNITNIVDKNNKAMEEMNRDSSNKSNSLFDDRFGSNEENDSII